MVDWLKKIKPDYLLVMGCPQILKRPLLDIPRLGSINYHYSALPKYGGCDAPFWSVLYGERETANTFHFVKEEIDVGSILVQDAVAIMEDDSVNELRYRLVMSAQDSLCKLLRQIATGNLTPTTQDLNLRIYRSAKDCIQMRQICWQHPAEVIGHIGRVGGILCAWLANGQKLFFSKISLELDTTKTKDTLPGTVVKVERDRILCSCRDSLIWLWKKKTLGFLHNPFQHKFYPGEKLLGREYNKELDEPVVQYVTEQMGRRSSLRDGSNPP